MAKQKTLGKVKQDVQKVVNEYVRKRDEGKPCISCGEYKPLQCGHFFAVSTHQGLRYEEDNLAGECLACNYYNESHLIKYRDNLLERIGEERFKALYEKAEHYKKHGYKFTREELAEIKKKYYKKIKELK